MTEIILDHYLEILESALTYYERFFKKIKKGHNTEIVRIFRGFFTEEGQMDL